MKPIKYVFISAPYAHPDPVENTHNAIGAADELRALGYVPFVPHLCLLWHIVCPHPPDYWYDWDNEWLLRCDAILRLPGASGGADSECELFLSIGRPVFTSIAELLETDKENKVAPN